MRFIASIVATATIGISLPIVIASPAGASQAARPTVYSWGNNSAHQLGDGGRGQNISLPGGVTALPDTYTDGSGTHAVLPVQVAAGDGYAVVRTSDGQVYWWGDGDQSAGASTGLPNGTPTRIDIPGLFGGRTARDIFTAGAGDAFAILNDNTLVGWGNDTNNLLGDGLATPSGPKVVTGGVIAGGCSSDSCFAVKSNGSGGTVLWGWGNGANGTFGEGSATSHPTPVQLNVPAIVNPTEVIGGNRVTAVLTATGGVRTMGFGQEGELGDGVTGSGHISNTPVTAIFPGGTTIAHLFSFQFGFYAIDTNGSIWSWGHGSALGDGAANDRGTPFKLTLDQEGKPLPSMSKVSGGFRHAVALAANGSVYAWGDNAFGQIGNGMAPSSPPAPYKISLPRAAVDVAASPDPAFPATYAVLTPPPAAAISHSFGTIYAQTTTPADTWTHLIKSDGSGNDLAALAPADHDSMEPSYNGQGQVYFASNRISSQTNTVTNSDLWSAPTGQPGGQFGGAPQVQVHSDATEETDPDAGNLGSGGQVVFATNAGGSYHLQVTSGGSASDVTPSGSNDRHPSWRQARLVWQRGTGAAAEIYAANANGITNLTNVHAITSNGVLDTNPALSPDATRIAYEETVGGVEKVFVGDFNGTSITNAQQLVTSLAQTYTPAWSPDGTTLVVGGINTSGQHDLFEFDATTRQQTAGPLYGYQYSDVRYPSWGSNFGSFFTGGVCCSGSNAITNLPASPQSVPLAALNQNGPSPASQACTGTSTGCSGAGTLGGSNPGRLPGSNPGRLPGSNPGRLPGSNPGRLPGSNPGRLPGSNPGRLPGSNPGRLPGSNPGRLGLVDLAQLGTDELGNNPLIVAGLKQIKLSSIGVGKGWTYYLKQLNDIYPPLPDGTETNPYLGGTEPNPTLRKSLTEISLYDILSQTNPPNLALDDMDVSNSALGKVSLFSWLMGDTRLGDITVPTGDPSWCSQLTSYLQSHGKGSTSCDAYGERNADGSVKPGGLAGASFIGLEIAGIPLEAFPAVDDLTLGNVTFTAHDGWLGEYPLEGIDLLHSAFGLVKLADLPAADANGDGVPDSTNPTSSSYKTAVNCALPELQCGPGSTQTLYQAYTAAGANNERIWNQDATIINLLPADPTADKPVNHISISEAIYGIAQNLVGDPLDAVKLSDLGFTAANPQAVNSTGTAVLSYYPTSVYQLSSPATMSVTLPAGYFVAPGTSSLNVLGGGTGSGALVNPAQTASTTSGNTFTWNLPTVTFGGTAPGMQLQFSVTGGSDLAQGGVIQDASVTTPDLVDTMGRPLTGRGNGSILGSVPATTNTDEASATPIAADTVYAGYITAPGQTRYYSLPAPAIGGSQIDIYLDHLQADADLLVYHPDNADAATPLRTPPGNAPGRIAATPDQLLSLASQAETVVPTSPNDYPVLNHPLAGVSDQRGLQFEHVGVLSFRSTGGRYLIQVTGHGAATTTAPFLLRAVVTAPNGLPDVGRSFPNSGSAATSAPSVPSGMSVNTLVLTDSERMAKIYGATGPNSAATVTTALNSLASADPQHTLVADISGWTNVENDFATWDAHPGEPENANDIVRDINADVDALMASSAGGRADLQHIVLVGTDEVIPMARLLDQTQEGNERDFASEVLDATATKTGGNNALLSGEAAGYVMSDDPYASFVPQPLLGGWIYPPSVAIGRLVETPSDIAGIVSEYVDDPNGVGVLKPKTGLATGYDYFADMATAIKNTLSQNLTGNVGSLIAQPGETPGWNRAALQNAYSGNTAGVPDVAEVTGHGTPTTWTPADGLTSYSTSELAGKDLTDKILFTLGCHTGFSITDYLADTGGIDDFAQATAHSTIAAFVGQTGYGLAGGAGTIAYGEQVMTGFAHDMTGRTLGQALAQAKLDYLAKLPNVYDAKALETATFYGLPMFTIGGPDQDAPPAPLAQNGSGPNGYPAAPFVISNPTGSNSNWQLHSTGDGGYYTVVNQQQDSNGLTAIEQHQPIQPRVALNVTNPSYAAHGVLITGLSSQDDAQFDPVLSRPTINDSASEPEQQLSNVLWPRVPQDLATNPTLSGGRLQTASITLGQFRSTGLAASGPSAGNTIGVQRRFTNVTGQILYGGSTFAAAPYFTALTVQDNGAGNGTTITAIADGGNFVKQVVVLAHLNGATGDWVSVPMTQQGTSSTWTGTTSLTGVLSPTSTRVEVLGEAVDLNGSVGSTFVPGGLYDPQGNANDPGPSASTTTVTAPASTVLGAPATVTVTVAGVGTAIAPNGTATVSDGSGATCTANLTNGTGSCDLTHNGVGSYTVTATFPTTSAFTGSSATTQSSVTKAVLTVTASNGTSAYGTTPSVTPVYSGFVLGDGPSAVTSAPSCSSDASPSSPPGTYTNHCSGGSSARYTFTFVDGTQTVSGGTLTVTGPTTSRPYGTADGTFTPQYSGFVNGEDQTSLTTQPTCTTTATQSSPVGDYPITCSGGVSDHYTFSYVAGVLHVTPATLTVTASSPTTTYGSVNLTVTANITGFVNNDTQSVLTHAPTCSTTATTASGAGGYPTTCTGATADNYAVHTVDGTLTIAKATLAVTASNASRTYGAANPAISPSYSGFKNGDTATAVTTAPTCQPNADSTVNVGTYTTSCSGGSAANYTFGFVNGTLTVTKAPITVQAPSAARLYGDPNPPFAATYTGFVNNDGSSAIGTAPTCSTTATPATHAGTVPVTCTGGSSLNYALTTYNPGTLTINEATLTITASNGTRVYGAANPTITPSYAGFKNSDGPSVVSNLACSANASASSPVDTYPTMCSSGTASDYTIVYNNGSLTVTPAALQIKASSVTRYYGDANPTVAPLYTGFVAGDDASKLGQAPVCVANGTLTSAAGGSYTTSCSSAAATNYTISYATGTLTVNPAPLTVTAPSPGKVYGQGNPALPPTYSGFANNETAATAGFTTAPTCTTTATTASHVGIYPVTCSGGVSGNYTFTYIGGTLSIGTAVLNVIPTNASRTYGAANPTFSFTYSGFQNGDTAATVFPVAPPTCTSSAGTQSSDVGSYDITCSGGVQNSSRDYALNYQKATLSVTPAPVTVNAPSASRQYGTANPAFVPTYTGLQNGQTALTSAPSCTTTATQTSAPGTYPIHCAANGANPNYSVGFGPDGTLTISKANTVITQTPVSVIGTVLAFRVRYTAVLKSASGASLSGETVSFSTTNTSLGNASCTAVTDATGTATCTSGLLTILSVVVNGTTTATFGGDPNYNGTSNTTAFTLT